MGNQYTAQRQTIDGLREQITGLQVDVQLEQNRFNEMQRMLDEEKRHTQQLAGKLGLAAAYLRLMANATENEYKKRLFVAVLEAIGNTPKGSK